ncbi:hypothetical protein [Phaeacidiphilus oryzae]|uniref:hypothetical protein n=1 Tax=Phaeacidiphilus oryzae TaxID=348818 RepID=UPI000B2463E2|nr:hypothetical protein [Phaeacidiphilus oryzae]
MERLLGLAERGLPAMYRPQEEMFAFGRIAESGSGSGPGPDSKSGSGPGGTVPRLVLRGRSLRYSAIVALGARLLDGRGQRAVLGGRSAREFTGLLIERLPSVRNLGDAALVAWAAAETGHPRLADALERVALLDRDDRPRYTVEAAWVLSALAAARDSAGVAVDVEEPLAAARERLLRSRIGGGPLFPHATGPGLVPWYRAHIGCFADQTYPLQALARVHAGAPNGDPAALAAAAACATRICELQGPDGQWWWHYDVRRGSVVEGYPVYSVHQHAMAPTALLDLVEAEAGTAGGAGTGGGSYGHYDYGAAIRNGLRWLLRAPELADSGVELIQDELGVTWRKAYRGDPAKAVRAVRGLASLALPQPRRSPGRPGSRSAPLDRLFRPDAVDRECRPYEFGWLLYAWLGGGRSR